MAIWKWIGQLPEFLPVWDTSHPLPGRIVVDWTRVKVGSRRCWIFTALDPKNWRLLYLWSTFSPDGWEVERHLLEMHELYGNWPQEVLSDHGEEWGVGLTEAASG